MVGLQLWDKTMVQDERIFSTVKIEWTQFPRCWWECREDFYELNYHENGVTTNPIFKVFVHATIPIPKTFNTKGFDDKLNLALFHDDIDMQFDSMVFVIMPTDIEIYQNRFNTDSIKEFIKVTGAALAGTAGGAIVTAAAAGGALGSVVPVAGTAVGAAVAAAGAAATFAFATNFDDFFGQYVHHIG